MKVASITEAKNTLSALIDGLGDGSPVLIVDRGRPVARLEPVNGGADEGVEGRLARLVRKGLMRPPRGSGDMSFLREPPPPAGEGPSLVDLLLEERREGR